MKAKSVSLIIKGLCWPYYCIGSIGGAILGFLSLGVLGLTIGLMGGLLMSFITHKSILKK